MSKIFSRIDWSLFIVSLILSFIGILIVWTLMPNLFIQQIIYLGLGLFLFFIFSLIDYRLWGKIDFLIFGLSILFLISPLAFGIVSRGALRWLKVGPFTIQPSEIVKPFIVIFFASYFSKKEKIGLKEVLSSFINLIVILFLIFIQPDLGSTLVLFASWVGILLITEISWKLIFKFFLSFSLFLPCIWIFFIKEYQKQRIFSFLNPFKDPLGAGYNIIQASVAVGAGQLLGRGLGKGTQSHLKFLPERHTDFIFSSLAEELGFIGSVFLLALFAILLLRILAISRQNRDNFGSFLAMGIFTFLFTQIFINIGGNLRILPITGITLPLVSYGGSSFVATMISLGIIENIFRQGKIAPLDN